jgi:AraC family transcriptional regulator
MTSDRLREILDLVERSLDEPDATGAQLAKQAFLSRFHFDRLLSGALGEPPGAFRRRLLLERAAYQLLATPDQVIEVALDAGYASPEAFTRAFAKAYGISPSRYRRNGFRKAELPAPSGVHFHPPGGLRLPPTTRSDAMDVLVRMLDHHLTVTGEIIDRLDGLPDTTLDRPIELSVGWLDRDPTLRSVSERLVSQLEMWVAALDGSTIIPPSAGAAPKAMRARLTVAGTGFQERLAEALADGRADETFLDATCDPPQTFSYGGVLAHVLTFSAARRTVAIGALERCGVTDLGSGDPMHFVGGSGGDASTIRRRLA